MQPPREQLREHLPEIDWLKGFAILCVICIHAKLTADSWFFLQVINRAVHVFLVLFGISSELWWRRELARAPERIERRWYLGRLRRIAPGYFVLTAIWWLAVTLWRAPPGNLELGPLQALLSFAGFAPWIGTSWFVAVILQYVLLFPILRRAVLWLGAPLSLLVSAAATFASCWFLLQIVTGGKLLFGDNVPWPGWYYQWIFAPRVLWDVTAGILIAQRWRGRVSGTTAAVAALLTVAGAFLGQLALGSDALGPVREMAVAHIVDVPLSIALLGLFRFLPMPASVRAFLAWCGVSSWGIYLAHLLVHELVQIAGLQPFMSGQWVRASYALGLFLAGATLTLLSARLDRELFARLRLSRAT
jgi:peptidoglycan/LPS O-acetylase OafA/YrhL